MKNKVDVGSAKLKKPQPDGTCDGGENNTQCKLGGKLFEPGKDANCSDAVPACGKWSEWSACEFEGNDGYGSCDKKDGIKTRKCPDEDICLPDENGSDTAACYTPKCEVKIDSNNLATLTDDKKRDVSNFGGEYRHVRLIFTENIVLTAPSYEVCAVTIPDKYKSMTLINHGVITGYRGKGGSGGRFDSKSPSSEDFNIAKLKGGNGNNGGDALCIHKNLENINIQNHGVIKGGRGGGGGAVCYIISAFDIVIEEGCLKGGDGGNGSDFYLQSIVAGKDEQRIINDFFVLESGKGGNGGYLFPNSLSLELNQADAHSGSDPLYTNKQNPSVIKVLGGSGGMFGNNGRVCRDGETYTIHKCKHLTN